MIKYENIAAETIYRGIFDSNFYAIISDYNVKTVQDIINLIDLGIFEDYQLQKINSKIERVTKAMNKANNKEKELVIYDVGTYEDTDLEYTDTQNNGDILLLANPTSYSSPRYVSLKRVSLSKIKDYIGLTTENGDNYLCCNSRNIGKETLSNVLEAIKMYNEQVERQAQLTKKRDINVFMYQKEEKTLLANDNYIDIIDYLLDTAEEELIWGKLSDNQRKLYLSTIDKNSESDKRIKSRIIDYVSNYTTVDEMEKINSGYYKVLNRFIRK